MKIKMTGLGLLLVVFLVGCSGETILSIIDKNYSLNDVIQSSTNPDDVAKVYIAEGQSIEEVTKWLKEEKQPERTSDKQDGKQVLVYDEYFVTLMKDEDQPENTQIEIAEYEFVRDNYQPSFFSGLLALYILDDILDVDDWGKRQKKRCSQSVNGCYGGYVGSGGIYKGPSKPSGFRGSTQRGGGPGAGK